MTKARKPVIGVLCGNEVAKRPIQAVATRFVAPLAQLAGACALLVPAVAETSDTAALADVLDGLLLTGSRTHVAAGRYGSDEDIAPLDEERDAVALALAERMIEGAKPVFGICRGMQEINVLFGGTLARERCGRHLRGGGWATERFGDLFDHRHDVTLVAGGTLARATGTRRLTVNSVHEQAIDRVGAGLTIEAHATDDDVVEAIAAAPCGAPVLGVQWHPEWDVERCAGSRAFFGLVQRALATSVAVHR